MTQETYPINVWINEERLAKLQAVNLADMAEEAFAGLKVLRVPCTEAQRDKVLATFPTAKYDSATTKSIEQLPRGVKDKIFNAVIAKGSLNIMDEFLAQY